MFRLKATNMKQLWQTVETIYHSKTSIKVVKLYIRNLHSKSGANSQMSFWNRTKVDFKTELRAWVLKLGRNKSLIRLRRLKTKSTEQEAKLIWDQNHSGRESLLKLYRQPIVQSLRSMVRLSIEKCRHPRVKQGIARRELQLKSRLCQLMLISLRKI